MPLVYVRQGWMNSFLTRFFHENNLSYIESDHSGKTGTYFLDDHGMDCCQGYHIRIVYISGYDRGYPIKEVAYDCYETGIRKFPPFTHRPCESTFSSDMVREVVDAEFIDPSPPGILK
jgi:hypothetical protein